MTLLLIAAVALVVVGVLPDELYTKVKSSAMKLIGKK